MQTHADFSHWRSAVARSPVLGAASCFMVWAAAAACSDANTATGQPSASRALSAPQTGLALPSSAPSAVTGPAEVTSGAPAAATAQAGASAPAAQPVAGNSQPTPTMAPGPTAVDNWGDDCELRPVFQAHAASSKTEKFRIPAGFQSVITFYFAAPWTGETQLLKQRAFIDNTRIVHHWALWAVDSTAANDGELRDTTEPLGGDQYVVGGGPGSTVVELPSNVGMRMPSGRNLKISLEIHYANSLNESDELDATNVELCLTNKKRPIEAALHSLGRASMELPAHKQTDIVSTCQPSMLTEPVHILAITPHMHLTGVHAKVVLNRRSGEQLVLIDKPYTFQEQRSYAMPEDRSTPDVIVSPGDTITSTCSYDNQTDKTINQGEHSQDEMCLMGMLAWPVGGLRNSWGALVDLVPSAGRLGDVICLEP